MTTTVTVSRSCHDGFQKDVMGLVQAESPGLLRHWGLGRALRGVQSGWDGSGGWYPASFCMATAEHYFLGLGAMAEVDTIVDKVKEVLSQHAGFQQN